MATSPVMFPDISGAQFVKASEVGDVAERVLDAHGRPGGIPRLHSVRQAWREGDIAIAFLLNTKAFDPASDEAKHDAIAKCIKAPTLWHDLTGYDVAIWVRAYFWERFDPTSREALMAHELLHLDVEYDDDGEVKLAIRKHDLEEFDDVARHFGAALPGIAEFNRAFAASGQPLKDLVDDPESGITSITVKAGGREATLRGRGKKDAPAQEEAARGFSQEAGKAALDELNRDLDGE